ncbi:Dipeptidyl aminopeptidase/acylaminoacyl peptidase [Pseudomonas cuatrocienegasensis]|uniref:Dipeptidyl aminopeptidase/acylaminoacyl peptidase n=1 Tax=Pseudomonas cuatrocienegasensis TaxID=543360 RepID=A0ABY1BPT1_9PSED|nr:MULTISPECIES: prolyl oligopeptidase family serine peptidase [Pseudomonas]OEC32837.1 peptidase S9 [Pseudomonas sp. 21C1]SER33017.1 Dipeptidyl aminopeptidase/acylaminoacyl peptidase [Pseudomonas cuatrocienegasensis]
MQSVGCADPELIWSAEQAAAASADFAELHAAHGGVLWVAFDPQQARCGLFFWRDGVVSELTPSGFSVRNRVYEYGGGACCATDQGVAFVNEGDQQIYRIDIDADGGAHSAPYQLSDSPHCRYGDLSFVPAWQALLAVEESHEAGSVVHRLVRIGLNGKRDVLVEGADFYAAPVADADGQRLVWIEWDRPSQPWVATRLCQRESGQRSRVLAGQAGEQSLQQPRFDPHNRLWVLSDKAGWWQPACVDDDTQACGAPYDHAPAPWQLGGRTYLPLGDQLLLSRFKQGVGVLLDVGCCGAAQAVRTDSLAAEAIGAHNLGGPASPYAERRLAEGFTRLRSLAADSEYFYCIAAAPDRLPAVLAISRDDGLVSILAGGEQPLSEQHLSRPEPLSCEVGEGERCHGFFYAPVSAQARPPLVIFLHGGPTSACYPVFDPRIAFWTLRGYAVLDLNYRGSSGYGRAYRLRLAGQWGALEVADIGAAIDTLAASQRIDPQRVFVRGASAGGFSALRALAELPQLRGGASLYGVSDPLALRRLTHKFEADYLDWLIGDPERDAERYQHRSPVLQAERITVPVIFFQGALDAVVVPSQTEAMVEALRQRGVPVAYHLFADERHGFRQAANLAAALNAELAFYRQCLG